MTKAAFKKENNAHYGGRAFKDRGVRVPPPKAPRPAQPSNAAEAHRWVRRQELLTRYAKDGGFSAEQLAARLMLTTSRIDDLLAGRAPISNELATHIEEMLELPASWLDDGGDIALGEPVMNATAAPIPEAVAPAERGATRTSPDKKQLNEIRRVNLELLTTARGSKSRLGVIAGTAGSRISLMTSARKPVSDPFAFAIEDGLGLARGWLDQPRQYDEVPPAVWEQLNGESGVPAAPAPVKPARAARSAPSAPHAASPALTPTPSPSPAPAAPAAPVPLASSRSASGLFDKASGSSGPIAEALAKTILNLSAADKLSEARAFQLLGVLLSEAEPTR